MKNELKPKGIFLIPSLILYGGLMYYLAITNQFPAGVILGVMYLLLFWSTPTYTEYEELKRKLK